MGPEVQHDDHIWMRVAGTAWAIERLEPGRMYLWRGYWPNLEFASVDTQFMNWDIYCESAVQFLESEGGKL